MRWRTSTGRRIVGAMVITGNEKAFAAGADIKEMADKSASEMKDRDYTAVFDRIRSIRKPVIAAVSGWALGAGCEVAMSCDMIVASESAKFGQPEITIGVIPGAGGTQRLTRAVGKAIAMEMILNNRTLNAQEAYQFGLVNRVVSVESYLDEALKLAEEIASRAPLAVHAAKKMINQVYEESLSDGLAEEKQEFYMPIFQRGPEGRHAGLYRKTKAGVEREASVVDYNDSEICISGVGSRPTIRDCARIFQAVRLHPKWSRCCPASPGRVGEERDHAYVHL